MSPVVDLRKDTWTGFTPIRASKEEGREEERQRNLTRSDSKHRSSRSVDFDLEMGRSDALQAHEVSCHSNLQKDGGFKRRRTVLPGTSDYDECVFVGLMFSDLLGEGVRRGLKARKADSESPREDAKDTERIRILAEPPSLDVSTFSPVPAQEGQIHGALLGGCSFSQGRSVDTPCCPTVHTLESFDNATNASMSISWTRQETVCSSFNESEERWVREKTPEQEQPGSMSPLGREFSRSIVLGRRGKGAGGNAQSSPRHRLARLEDGSGRQALTRSFPEGACTGVEHVHGLPRVLLRRRYRSSAVAV